MAVEEEREAGSEGVDVQLHRLRDTHNSDVIADILEARAILVGSPTLNNGLFPSVASFLVYMKGLKPLNKIGAAFGSYGWSGEAVKLINKELEAMKFDVIDPGIRIQYVPEKKGLNTCFELGQKIGKAINEKR